MLFTSALASCCAAFAPAPLVLTSRSARTVEDISNRNVNCFCSFAIAVFVLSYFRSVGENWCVWMIREKLRCDCGWVEFVKDSFCQQRGTLPSNRITGRSPLLSEAIEDHDSARFQHDFSYLKIHFSGAEHLQSRTLVGTHSNNKVYVAPLSEPTCSKVIGFAWVWSRRVFGHSKLRASQVSGS
jgi:hypothetical protein